MESHQEVYDTSHDPNSENHELPKPEEEQIITPSPSKLLEDRHVASNKESPKPVRIRIKPLTAGTRKEEEEEEPTNPPPSNDQQCSAGPSCSVSASEEPTTNSIETELECIEGSSSTSASGEIKMQDDNAESAPTCKLCARSFKSHKALCGHMRSHSMKEVTRDDEDCSSNQVFAGAGTSAKEQHGLIGLARAAAELQNGTMEIYDAEPETKRIKLGWSDGRHACHICGKSFPTHQALGGHTSSHNKDKRKQSEDGDQTSKKSKKKMDGDSEHRCKKCGAVFMTGQSLGGHMRAHYDLGKSKRINDPKVDTVMEEAPPLQTTKDASIILFGKSISKNVIKEINRSTTVEKDVAEKNTFEEIAFLENVRGEFAGPVLNFNEIPESEAEEMCRLKL